jgi:hypothetical protein
MKDASVQVEIDARVIESLLVAGTLCLNDIRALNSASKQVLRSLCLSSCVNSLHCDRLTCRRPSTRDCHLSSMTLDK